MSLSPKRRRGLAMAMGLVLALLGLTFAARLALTTLAVSALLQKAGASEIRFNVAQASLWRVVVENLRFQMQTQVFSARRVSVTRPHWWTPSLGAIRVEQARVPVRVAGLAAPAADATPRAGLIPPLVLPMDEITVDGQLVIQARGLPEQSLAVKFAARLAGKNTWTATLQAAAPGLEFKAAGEFDADQGRLDFRVPEFSLDLQAWQEFGQKIIPLPDGPWAVAGRVSGSAQGRLAGGSFTGSASVKLREGRAANAQNSIVMDGIEADLEITDFDRFATKPGTLRLRELRAGRLVMRELDCGIAFASTNQVVVTKATFQALGGRVSTEPFSYALNPRELRVVVLVEDISVEEVLALTQDLPAKATGRLNGRFPIQVDDGGVRFGTGWLELKPGVRAEIQFNASGLLTRGVSASNPSYAVLQRVESGLLKLQLNEMRLDIRPPNAPPGRSAQLHIAGEPVDKDVRAPVTLDLNVNGPLEKLINLGLDSRLSIGAKR